MLTCVCVCGPDQIYLGVYMVGVMYNKGFYLIEI